MFDFNVHPKKLPESESNNILNTDPAQTSGGGVDKGTGAGMNLGRTDVLNSETRSPSSSLSTRSTSPSSISTIASEVSYRVETEPTKIPTRGVFVNDVISKLPYTHTVRKDLCAAYSGFMIDDERIVGLKVRVPLLSWRAFRELNFRYILFIGFGRRRDGRYRRVCILNTGYSSQVFPAVRC